MKPDALAAELIEASVSGYAAAAANDLLKQHPAIESRYGAGALASWRAHFVQRLLELAAAIRVDAPAVFAARAVWQHKSFIARELHAEDLREALTSLRSTLLRELPDEPGQLVAGYVDHALAVLDAGVTLDPSELDPADPLGALALRYVAACLDGDPQRAIAMVLEAAAAGQSLEVIYARVIFPVLREVGRMWHGAEASIAEERVITETTRRLMTLLTHEHAKAADVGKTVIAAAVAGNAHDIGVRAVADFFEIAGWRALSLGSDVPPAEIAGAVQFFNADLVVLSTTLATQIKSLQASITAIRSASGDSVKILVGGPALAETPGLWQRLGADGFAAASDAVSAGNDLVGVERSG